MLIVFYMENPPFIYLKSTFPSWIIGVLIQLTNPIFQITRYLHQRIESCLIWNKYLFFRIRFWVWFSPNWPFSLRPTYICDWVIIYVFHTSQSLGKESSGQIILMYPLTIGSCKDNGEARNTPGIWGDSCSLQHTLKL